MEKRVEIDVKSALVGLIVGILLAVGIYFILPVKTNKEIDQQEDVRETLNAVIADLEYCIEQLEDERATIKRRSDSVLRLKERSYQYRLNHNRKIRNENIQYINTVDSAYLDILSRKHIPVDTVR